MVIVVGVVGALLLVVAAVGVGRGLQPCWVVGPSLVLVSEPRPWRAWGRGWAEARRCFGSLRALVVVATVGLVVGCVQATEPAAEPLDGPGGDSGGVAVGVDAAVSSDASGDASVGDADVGGDGVIDDDVAVDGLEGTGGDLDVGVVDDVEAVDGTGVVGDGDEADAVLDAVVGGDGIEDGGGDVDDLGGLVVEDYCGWPGPLCAGDASVAAIDEGGRLWWRDRSQWESWVGRVLDLCDDHEALAAIDGELRSSGVGDPIPSYNMARIVEMRERYPIVCSEAEAATPHWKCWNGGTSELRAYLEGFGQPPDPSEVLAWARGEGLDCYDAAAERRRYVYVTVSGPLLPEASVEAAVEAYLYRAQRWADGPSNFVPANALGYLGPRPLVESLADELGVLERTVNVADGVLRGLAQNRSARLWARHVEVTATDSSGGEGVWRFPLAVQPGEAFPFEIEGWAGSDDPSEIDFVFSADLSPTIDLSRSLKFDWGWSSLTQEEFWEYENSDIVAGEIPDGPVHLFEAIIRRAAPAAHPRLAKAALLQPIENLTVIAATFKDGLLFDVLEVTPASLDSSWRWVAVRSLPAELPDGSVATQAMLKVVGQHGEPLIWAGGAVQGPEASNEP